MLNSFILANRQYFKIMVPKYTKHIMSRLCTHGE